MRRVPVNPRSFVEHGWGMEDGLHYKLLKVLEENPDVTQRELAWAKPTTACVP